jgi:thiamine-phosphate pyrophosphorylase
MAADKFILCAITSPDFIDSEAEKICITLDAGFDWVHLRKPGSDINAMRELIMDIPTRYHSRLRLHDNFCLTDEFAIGGIQLNSRCNSADSRKLSLSRSCHSLTEANSFPDYDYVTLSPIFDSISKSDYSSKFDLATLKIGDNVVALGGVTPNRFDELINAGFMGAALLGYLNWQLPIELYKKHIHSITSALKQCYNS